MTLIRGIIFDFDATLGKGRLDRQKWYSHMYMLLRAKTGLSLDYQVYERTLLNSLSVLNKKRMDTEIEPTFHEYYGAAFADLGISPSPQLLDTAYQLMLDNYSFEFYPFALDVLQQLKDDHFVLSIVSNTVNGTTRPVLEEHGIISWFTIVIQSCDVGIRKPSPKIFQIALDHIRAKPEEVISVGNSPYFDIYGAQQIGMQTVQIMTELSYREPKVEFEIKPDYTIDRIEELIHILNELHKR